MYFLLSLCNMYFTYLPVRVTVPDSGVVFVWGLLSAVIGIFCTQL